MRDPGHFDLTECGFIVIEDKSCRYELDAEGSVLRYRSIISPTFRRPFLLKSGPRYRRT